MEEEKQKIEQLKNQKKQELNVKNIFNNFKKKGVFYTRDALALKLKSYLPKDLTEVYDLTCGQGNLLALFPDSVKKYGQDIDPKEIEKARKLVKNFTGYVGDTLEDPKIERPIDYIIANIPFSIEWNPKTILEEAPIHPTKSRADYAFIFHILKYCRRKASTLQFPGILYRPQREARIREWLVNKNYIEVIESNEKGNFVDTKIKTATVVFSKEKTSTSILMKAQGKERLVTLEEIKQNHYILTPELYLKEPRKKLNVNINEVNAKINKLQQEIKNDINEINELIEKIEKSETIENLEKKWIQLQEIAMIEKGAEVYGKDLDPNGQYKVVRGGFKPNGQHNQYNREKNTITIAQGGSVGSVNFMEERFFLGNHAYSIEPIKEIVEANDYDYEDFKIYLYNFLKYSEPELGNLATGSTIKHLKPILIKEFKIPLITSKNLKEITKVLKNLNTVNNGVIKKIETETKLLNIKKDYFIDSIFFNNKNN